MAAALAVVTVAPGRAVMQTPNISSYSVSQVIGGNAIATLAEACPSGFTPVSGQYVASSHGNVRRLEEFVNYGSGASYQVTLYNEGSPQTVTATVRCAILSYFGGYQWATSTADVGADHIATAVGSCPAGWFALSVSTYFAGLGTTVLTTTPTSNFQGWIVRGWHDNVDATMTVKVNCVPAADLPGMRVYSHDDAASGWGTGASASCPSGLAPLTGGTFHQNGDNGAITVMGRAEGPGFTSLTLNYLDSPEEPPGFIRTTVVCLPTQFPSVSVTGYNVGSLTSTTAHWDFSAFDPSGAGGYGMTLTCSLREAPNEPYVYDGVPCSSSREATGLSEGTWELTVTATTGDGRVNRGWAHVTVDHSPPVVDFADAPGRVHGTSQFTVAVDIGDAFSLVTSLTCAVDSGPAVGCGQSNGTITNPSIPGCGSGCPYYQGTKALTFGGVADGVHTLKVTATDNHTNAVTQTLQVVVDTVAPAVTQTGPTARFTVGTNAKATWTGQDATSGIASYQTRWRRARYNAGYGAWSTPAGTTATSRTFGSLQRGNTYCFGVRAFDKAGHASGWTAGRCTAIPLDDRDLADSSGWRPVSPAGWFAGTGLVATAQGASLSVTGAMVKRVAVVAKKCPTCGVVGVYVAGSLVARVDLRASTTSRATITLPAFSTVRTGTVKLRVLSSGKPVQVDALGLSRA